MAELNIDLIPTIHAKILEGNFTMSSKSSVTVDPLTKSYSDNGLIEYALNVVYSEGVSNIIILPNGKNSRISAQGQGYFQLELIISDSKGLTDNDIIIITVQ